MRPIQEIFDEIVSIVEESKTQSEWIPIKDQLPAINTWVLVYSSYPVKEYDHGAQIFVAQMTPDKDFEAAHGDGYIADWVNETITHWMLVPSKPKETE